MDALYSLQDELSIQLPDLVDYKVHIPRGGTTSALTEASISWRLEGGSMMTTRSTNANQVYAAILATLKMVNTLIHRAKGH